MAEKAYTIAELTRLTLRSRVARKVPIKLKV